MGWNEPGDKNPWNNGAGGNKPGGNRPGGRPPGGDQGPPDLDELARKIQERMAGLFGGGGKGDGDSGGTKRSSGGGKGLGLLFVIAAVIWLAYDMTYIIQEGNKGVVRRFGEYVETIGSGPELRLPRPIETVTRVDVQRVRNTSYDGVMLTQDENIVDLELEVQYRIADASQFLFVATEAENIIRLGTASAIREVVGKNKMDFVLKEGRTEVAAGTKQLLQELLDDYKIGLIVTTVNMGDAQPPNQVQHAFNDAIKAREDAERLENEAEAYANDVLPRARGQAARVTQEAEAYKESVIAKAVGEASRFEQILTEYQQAPQINRDRMYLDALEDVLSSTSKVIVDVEDGGNQLIYLPLDKMMNRSDSSSAAAASNSASTAPQTSQPDNVIRSGRDRGTRSRDRR